MNHKLWQIIYESLFMNNLILTSLYYFDPVWRSSQKVRWVWWRWKSVVWWRQRVGDKIKKSINWMWTAPSGWDLILILDWLPLKLSFPDFRLTLNNETDQRKWILILSGKKRGLAWPAVRQTKFGKRNGILNVQESMNKTWLTLGRSGAARVSDHPSLGFPERKISQILFSTIFFLEILHKNLRIYDNNVRTIP